MNAEPVSWTPALIALAIGAVIGIIALIRSRSARGEVTAAPDSTLVLHDLEGERDSLLARLRELQDLASTRSADQIREERRTLELRAAEVLREIDHQAPARRPAASPSADESRPARPAWSGFALGAGVVVALVAILLWVDRAAEPKPGTEMASGAQQAAAMNAPQLASLAAAVSADPENDDLRLDYARALLVSEQLMEVYRETQHVLQRRPGDPRGLTYQSIVLLAMGQTDQALGMLAQARQADPQLLDAWVHTAFVYAAIGDATQADAAMNEAIRRHPEQKPALQELARQIKAGMSS
jgi:tetratricopeptide (TPR) repeat protein